MDDFEKKIFRHSLNNNKYFADSFSSINSTISAKEEKFYTR